MLSNLLFSFSSSSNSLSRFSLLSTIFGVFFWFRSNTRSHSHFSHSYDLFWYVLLTNHRFSLLHFTLSLCHGRPFHTEKWREEAAVKKSEKIMTSKQISHHFTFEIYRPLPERNQSIFSHINANFEFENKNVPVSLFIFICLSDWANTKGAANHHPRIYFHIIEPNSMTFNNNKK